MPTTSQSAVSKDSGLTLHDETLNYEEDQEIQKGEIWEDGEQTVDKEVQWGKGEKSVNKERSLGVLQELTFRMVQRDQTGEKDSRIPNRGLLQKACYVPGVNNDIADALSCSHWQRLYGLAPGADLLKTALPVELWEPGVRGCYN
ncbi:hypothetical protein NDU88_003208 [Pleurodeles waltl]|uniref:Uncharacterized protein n=1 Tax=Pleurodeles waltl TaxID=8319 RepID=A0AAV7UBH2_PLEWA|nr:hypothetical protein NDU88_003208 [Pleurodeles waltl]